jgi:hypothetical protein
LKCAFGIISLHIFLYTQTLDKNQMTESSKDDTKPKLQRRKTLAEEAIDHTEGLSGLFRGVAAAMRKAAIGKAVAGKVAAKVKDSTREHVPTRIFCKHVTHRFSLFFFSQRLLRAKLWQPRLRQVRQWQVTRLYDNSVKVGL